MARKITYQQAINEALDQEMARDENVIIMGEDVVGGSGATQRHYRSSCESQPVECGFHNRRSTIVEKRSSAASVLRRVGPEVRNRILN